MEQISLARLDREAGSSGLARTAWSHVPLVREYCAIDLYDPAGRWVDGIVYQGDESSVHLDLRQVAIFLTGSQCPYVLIRHGHPSGIMEPSAADIRTTRALFILARLLGLHLHDHIIEAENARFSFREAGLL